MLPAWDFRGTETFRHHAGRSHPVLLGLVGDVPLISVGCTRPGIACRRQVVVDPVSNFLLVARVALGLFILALLWLPVGPDHFVSPWPWARPVATAAVLITILVYVVRHLVRRSCIAHLSTNGYNPLLKDWNRCRCNWL